MAICALLVSRAHRSERMMTASSSPPQRRIGTMDRVVLDWLGRVGWIAFSWGLAGLLVLNITAIVLFLRRRDRTLVDRWTAPWLAMNVLLLAIAVGVPTVTTAARLVVVAGANTLPGRLLLSTQTPESGAPSAN
jgi:hypothetical protein